MPNSIVDPTIEEVGNPARALEQVQAATTAQTQQSQTSTAQSSVQIPDRFKDKSKEEMYQIYANLEKHAGKLANDLGYARGERDQLLAFKRENDLRANGAQQVTRQSAAPVTATDLLENPTQALDRYFETKESATVRQLQERLAAQEAAMQQNVFVTRHPDWQEHTNDPAFIEWARQTPWRANLAVQAAQNNVQAADALLTEYKSYKPLLDKQTTQATGLEAARKVGLERSASTGDGSQVTGPIIRKADMMALRVNDPDKYDSPAVQNALLKAIAEGRYK